MASFSGGGNDFPPLLGRDTDSEGGYWVVMETVNYSKTAAQLPLFTVKKFLQQAFPGTLTAKPTKEGKLIIQAATKKIALLATKYKRFYEECDIVISAMESMNYRQGSIYGREILTCTVEELEKELKNQNVVRVERAMSMKDGVLTPNGLHILTFDATRLPDELYVGYMRYSVRTYYPRPLRCSRCCIFGHSRKRCEAKDEACRFCELPPHQGTPCLKKYCRNCKCETHGTFEKECPKFEEEVAIVRLKVDKNWSYGQARAFLTKEVQKATDSYMNTILERYQKAARERAGQSEEVKAAIMQNEKEMAELQADLMRLEETTKQLEELKNKKETVILYNQTLIQSIQNSDTANNPNSGHGRQPIVTRSQTIVAQTEMMETGTNLKRKSTAEIASTPFKYSPTTVTMKNYLKLTEKQREQINQMTKSKNTDSMVFVLDENQELQVRKPKNKAEKEETKKLLQWIDYSDIDLTQEEASLVEASL
jgi:hypothetical protein